ncbi:MAG: hypothetical protein PF569_06485 [Candidatus Woesearchaeota archaeon]|jgi:hypothetical protein|nr:hypothetical protein [Candidatus Woesearchaeota archaeon]
MKELNYIDIPISGNKKNGLYIKNNDALDNAFRLWITSSPNEFLRRQGGGILLRHIGKPLNDARALEIRRSIQRGVSNDFSPALEILNLTVTPNYTRKRWEILLVGYSEQFRVGINQTYLISNEG